LSFDLLDELERDSSFQREFAIVDGRHEVRDIVHARKQTEAYDRVNSFFERNACAPL
jgi:hypothetical protein